MTVAEQIAAAAIDTYGAIQHHEELAGLLEYLDRELEPDPAIVEVGSDAGGTLYAWWRLRPAALVVAVSLSDGAYATPRPCNPHSALVVDGDSHDPAVRARAAELLAGRRPSLVFIDGDHSLAGCRADAEWAAELLEPGGLLVLHDIAPHELTPIGCPIVWAELLEDRRWWGPRTFVKAGADWGGLGLLERTDEP